MPHPRWWMIVASCVLTLALAHAQDPAPEAPPRPAEPQDRSALMLERLDEDSDGKISESEFPGPPEAFARMDQDKDGFLTGDEMRRGRGNAGGGFRAQRLERLRQADGDGDGKVSRDEFPGPPQMFDRLDHNSDGFITTDELPEGGPEAPRAPSAPPTPEDMAQRMREMARMALTALFRRWDADQDGTLTGDEWRQVFQNLDGNGDGSLTQEEIVQAMTTRQPPATETPTTPPAAPEAIVPDPAPEPTVERPRRPARPPGPDAGAPAPDFTLSALHGEETMTLSSFQGEKPVVLIFGSYT